MYLNNNNKMFFFFFFFSSHWITHSEQWAKYTELFFGGSWGSSLSSWQASNSCHACCNPPNPPLLFFIHSRRAECSTASKGISPPLGAYAIAGDNTQEEWGNMRVKLKVMMKAWHGMYIWLILLWTSHAPSIFIGAQQWAAGIRKGNVLLRCTRCRDIVEETETFILYVVGSGEFWVETGDRRTL